MKTKRSNNAILEQKKKIKDFKDLTLMNDFMFGAVMEDTKVKSAAFSGK